MSSNSPAPVIPSRDVQGLVRFLAVQYKRIGGREAGRTVVRILKRPASNWWFPFVVEVFSGKSVLEIGGPSTLFQERGRVPIYPVVRSWDNVDFASQTLWSPNRAVDQKSEFNGTATGHLTLAEATILEGIPPESYDGVLTSHVVEHLANPIQALREWRRVMRPGGHLLVVVPDGPRSRDHARRVTTPSHLLLDFENHTGEDDRTHVLEASHLYDLSLDPAAGTRSDFTKRCQENIRIRALHHHVFDFRLLGALVSFASFEPELVCRVPLSSLMILARKPR